MAFIRVKQRGGRRYAYLVESVWDPEAGSPRQRVLTYLGPADHVNPKDVPVEHRKAPAVVRWLKENATQAAAAYETDLGAHRERLRAALLALDRDQIAEETARTLHKVGPWVFLEEVATPLLRGIGEDWYEGRITPVQEHQVTRGVAQIVNGLREDSLRDGARRRGPRATILLGNPEGEAHALALEILECRLAALGHRTIVVSGGVPRRDFAVRARELKADLVLVSATLPGSAAEALRTAEAVLEKCPTALVALGGQAWAHGSPPRDLDPRIRVVGAAKAATLDGLVEAALNRGATAPSASG
ncbi:MAG TPA: B12-binding domain-containing protein [Candidatus Thermoplasmatota archaeon]|nr:B12-binding domain-containing protein [Candidatus Thermoplasmatota archaeon]